MLLFYFSTHRIPSTCLVLDQTFANCSINSSPFFLRKLCLGVYIFNRKGNEHTNTQTQFSFFRMNWKRPRWGGTLFTGREWMESSVSAARKTPFKWCVIQELEQRTVNGGWKMTSTPWSLHIQDFIHYWYIKMVAFLVCSILYESHSCNRKKYDSDVGLCLCVLSTSRAVRWS